MPFRLPRGMANSHEAPPPLHKTGGVPQQPPTHGRVMPRRSSSLPAKATKDVAPCKDPPKAPTTSTSRISRVSAVMLNRIAPQNNWTGRRSFCRPPGRDPSAASQGGECPGKSRRRAMGGERRPNTRPPLRRQTGDDRLRKRLRMRLPKRHRHPRHRKPLEHRPYAQIAAHRPCPLISRMSCLYVSDMKRLPAASRATLDGPYSLTFPAPSPASVEIVPLTATLRIRLLRASAIYRLPAPSTATPAGCKYLRSPF